MWHLTEEEASPCVRARNIGSNREVLKRRREEKNSSEKSGIKAACMAPQSCVMNPAQGSPSLAAPEGTLVEDRADKNNLSPVRRCKNKNIDLPFSVESLISDRTPSRSLHSPEPAVCLREETECASTGELCRTKTEVMDLGDKETSPWFQAPYASPTSERRIRFFYPKRRFICLSIILNLFREFPNTH